MNYTIKLNTGEIINTTIVDFNIKEFVNKLNDNSIIFIDIENTAINKYIISSVTPSEIVDEPLEEKETIEDEPES